MLEKVIELIELWGTDVWVEFSSHALTRRWERRIVLGLVLSDIKSAEEEIGELLPKDNFAIVDKFANITIVCELKSYNQIVVITIIDKGTDFIPKNPEDKIIILS